MKKLFVIIYGLLTMTSSWSQTVISFTTTEQVQWAKSKGSLSSKKEGKVVAEIDAQMKGIEFSAFGTTFNELDLLVHPKFLFFIIYRQITKKLCFHCFKHQFNIF